MTIVDENSGAGVRRRTVVRGAAWAVPAVVVATSAPAFASSPVPPGGLNGWVELERSCGAQYPTTLTIDGTGSYSSRGLWVYMSPPGPSAPTGADIIFYFQKNNLSFTNSSGAGWSNLTRVPSLDVNAPATGFYAYQTVYTGAWTPYDPAGTANDRWEAATDPKFSTTYSSSNGCVNITAYARRTVTTATYGSVTFLRGPVTLA